MNEIPDPSGCWHPARPGLTLSPNHVDVWRCSTDLSPEVIAEFAADLSDDERLKADRLRDSVKRVESIAARGILRRVLGGLLACEPREIEFGVGPQGKPYLVGPTAQTNMGFNVSHTRGMVLIAVAVKRDVGVDVERVRLDFTWQPVARQFFPPDEAALLASLPEREGRLKFFQSWVRKEARLKAAGVGMALGIEGAGGEAVDLDVGEGYAAAVGVMGEIMGVRRWDFE